MTRKIFQNAFLLGACVLMVCAVLFFVVEYEQKLKETYEALEGEAQYAACGLELGGREYLERLKNINRVTWIAADGSVLYDSQYRDLRANQGDYPEVKNAFLTGAGQGERRSDSGGVSTMYYAFLCRDGTVLRLSRPLSAVRYALLTVSPVLWMFLLVLLISGLVAFRLAKQILKPVNELNLDAAEPEGTYPELEPLVRRIQEQRLTILRDSAERENLRKEFFSNVSHELKTPLTSISGFAELMRDGLVPPEKVAEFAGDIYRESQRLITLVDDILRLSRLEEEQGFPEPTRLDLYATAEAILGNLSYYARRRGVTLTLRGEHTWVEGIPQVVHEIISNLVDNAIKYNREGGSVTVTVEAQGSSICVADTGIGIPKEEQSRVFERFYRVDKSHSKQIGGTGLGLSIVKHGAQLLGAQVRLESEPGVGTSVTVLF